ncbi:uncharacterized protein K489DRAFT_214051 [Dissoconium aciculare CBS 342.82]|uniref:Uncharacterized protein n=1 Tax=Dissoconium aciculare CBS 342.82 TaxID=1314786 RepID=A0A6J3M461_9PEZI|nr:uncharacterized protein K489DRAFT_214051 [Dissoconium aciculare CBS 342.82]KAF1822688.1 hypothetical protein K489DRAFT_214051 [Dissoconium aciculare CBS 342.82]
MTPASMIAKGVFPHCTGCASWISFVFALRTGTGLRCREKAVCNYTQQPRIIDRRPTHATPSFLCARFVSTEFPQGVRRSKMLSTRPSRIKLR